MTSPSSPTRDFLRSRSAFENVFQILPQGHDKALKHAFYNTAATLFVVLASCAAVAVYYILEPFLRPLLWAMLCGTFLFPFKCTLTNVARRWLRRLKSSGTPLFVGLAILPISTVDCAAEKLGNFGWRYWKGIVVGCVVIPGLYFVFSVWPVQSIFDAFVTLFYFVYEALGYFNSLWVWSLLLGYIVVLVIFWTPERNVLLKLLSFPVWLAVVSHLATVVGPFRVPLVLVAIALVFTGFLAELNDVKNAVKNSSWLNARLHHGSDNLTETTSSDDLSSVASSDDLSAGEPESTEEGGGGGAIQPELTPATVAEESLPSPTAEEAKEEEKVEGKDHDTAQIKPALKKTTIYRPSSLHSHGQRKSSKTGGERSLSDLCFIGLFWSLLVVHLWIYKFVFMLLPMLTLCYSLKRLGEYLGLWSGIRDWTKVRVGQSKERLVGDPRMEILIPKPIRRFGKLLLDGDSKIIATLDGTMDKMISVLIIVLLIVGVVLVTLFAGIEIHRESMHLVHVSSNILNKTHHPELTHWLPDQEVVDEALDSMVNNAYVYGREWITNKLHGLLSGDDANREQVEKQVLKLWDKMYVSWFTKNKTSHDGESLKSQMSLDLSDVSSVSDVVTKFQDFHLDIFGFAQENVGLFISLMKSVWSVLVSNVALTVKVLMSMLSLIFGGGTAILNVVLSAVVFLTTLFYLLSSSGKQYKPAELFSSLSPAQGSGDEVTFGKAFEDAIGSVFLASIKMAAFYGLYTWLTHTIFGIQIVFIPSALAAMFAAVPFVGTYCAALPAVIELWLVNGQKFEAILLFVAHYLPTLFVDTAVYSEIKGGHPYLTGLAIAGGMYWMGLEGAIIGPIVLCCLIVAVNMYQNMLKPDTEKQKEVTSVTDKRVKFNLASDSNGNGQ